MIVRGKKPSNFMVQNVLLKKHNYEASDFHYQNDAIFEMIFLMHNITLKVHNLILLFKKL